jgi:hypothetical protein
LEKKKKTTLLAFPTVKIEHARKFALLQQSLPVVILASASSVCIQQQQQQRKWIKLRYKYKVK